MSNKFGDTCLQRELDHSIMYNISSFFICLELRIQFLIGFKSRDYFLGNRDKLLICFHNNACWYGGHNLVALTSWQSQPCFGLTYSDTLEYSDAAEFRVTWNFHTSHCCVLQWATVRCFFLFILVSFWWIAWPEISVQLACNASKQFVVMQMVSTSISNITIPNFPYDEWYVKTHLYAEETGTGQT